MALEVAGVAAALLSLAVEVPPAVEVGMAVAGAGAAVAQRLDKKGRKRDQHRGTLEVDSIVQLSANGIKRFSKKPRDAKWLRPREQGVVVGITADLDSGRALIRVRTAAGEVNKYWPENLEAAETKTVMIHRRSGGPLGVRINTGDLTITRVDADGAASAAGVKVGWRTLSINGTFVRTERDWDEAMSTAGTDFKMTFVVENNIDYASLPSHVVQGGHVVAVKDFITDSGGSENKVTITAGTIGTVQRIDKDGDALINFEGVKKLHWVRRSNFGNVQQYIDPYQYSTACPYL